MLSQFGLYYADWLIHRPQQKSGDALNIFIKRLEQSKPAEIKLKKNDALFIDNKRVLHGRKAFYGNTRRLVRYWIKTRIHIND
nr:TauD/TfdA family dioxygenase [Pleionea sp. CnH1-48]